VLGRVTNLQHTHLVGGVTTNLANYTYTYDAQGRVTTEVRNSTTVTYTYDAADQLTGDGTNTETYDATATAPTAATRRARITNDQRWDVDLHV